MAEPVGPKFVPKAVLTAGRVAHQPFEIPTEMTKSALIAGGVSHASVGGINKALADGVKALEPRGPAKFLEKLFGKVDSSLVGSAAQAQKATEVFWVPFSNGAHQIGHAVSNPFSLFYAKRAGFEIPADPAAAQALLASITDPNPDSTKFPGFTWPAPPPPAEAPPAPPAPGGETPPPAPEGGGETTPTPEGGGETTPTPEGGGETTPTPEGGGDVAATDQGPATDTGVASEMVGSPVPEGSRPLTPVDPAAPATGPTDAAAGAEAVLAPVEGAVEAPAAGPVAPEPVGTPG